MSKKPKPILIAPLIHLNGDTKESLLEALGGALDAIRTAEETLRATAPNARNFYPISPEAFSLARDQYWARVTRLQSVINELSAISEAILNGTTEARISPSALMGDDAEG